MTHRIKTCGIFQHVVNMCGKVSVHVSVRASWGTPRGTQVRRYSAAAGRVRQPDAEVSILLVPGKQ